MAPAIASRQPMNTPSTTAPSLAGPVVCALCHTADPVMTIGTLKAGADWRCSRCGQRWDAARLTAVADYEVWLAERIAAAGKSHGLESERQGDLLAIQDGSH